MSIIQYSSRPPFHIMGSKNIYWNIAALPHSVFCISHIHKSIHFIVIGQPTMAFEWFEVRNVCNFKFKLNQINWFYFFLNNLFHTGYWHLNGIHEYWVLTIYFVPFRSDLKQRTSSISVRQCKFKWLKRNQNQIFVDIWFYFSFAFRMMEEKTYLKLINDWNSINFWHKSQILSFQISIVVFVSCWKLHCAQYLFDIWSVSNWNLGNDFEFSDCDVIECGWRNSK